MTPTLNTLFATEVMGWEHHHETHTNFGGWFGDEGQLRIADGDFDPCSSIEQAIPGIEKMIERGFTPEIDYRQAGWAVCLINYGQKSHIEAQLEARTVIEKTLAKACVLACLKAVGCDTEQR